MREPKRAQAPLQADPGFRRRKQPKRELAGVSPGSARRGCQREAAAAREGIESQTRAAVGDDR